MSFDDPTKEKGDLNAVLIPRDITQKRGFGSSAFHAIKSALQSSETLGDVCTKIVSPRKNAPARKQSSRSGVDTTQQAEIAKKQAEKEELNRKETGLRIRARELQNQISWWNAQRGTGQYDDTYIDSMLNQFKSELNTIDSRYWY